ncbi:hypothetical protein GMDG_07220 [Pseudogymnoascus destructans 20631-21]|uniref:NmrA-like domain-containing protein n=1 Tax=Pseudogymnoascus destructans (strain ATCC MYA-4855 / 20631-21) TaxID=658429 RepID=L8FXB2_PSED2|nr:hypothetical protein GMDG_07220 [Pseudogymnoascus destructans 20631-21]
MNDNGKILEYCLFQPGLFLNYLASPHRTSKVVPLNTMFDFEKRRAIVVEGHDFVTTFTPVQDLTGVVVEAIEPPQDRTKEFEKFETRHPSVSEEQASEALKSVLISTLQNGAKGAWDVSDEFNRILPEYKFTQTEDFLDKVWNDKP